MFKKLLAISSIVFLSAAPTALASDLIISKNSDFSNPSTNFSTGQTIYIKVSANSDGANKHELSLRDNEYNLISTYNLDSLGSNQFKGSLPTPQNSGYYSLEARIESAGSVTSSTKTINVGDSNNTNSNVKVHVNVSASGQSTQNRSSQNSPSPKSSPSPKISPEPNDDELPSPSTITSPAPSSSPDAEKEVTQKDFFEKIFSFFDKFLAAILR